MTGAAPALAVIPAAGLGTRLRPLSEVVPKEMLTLGRLPVLGHVLAEIRDAGIRNVSVVVSPAKEMIRRYVGHGAEWDLDISVAVQETMRGVGDAVLTGIPPGVNGPVLAAFGDCAIMRPSGSAAPSAARRLVDAYVNADAQAAVLCETVSLDRVHLYGVLDPLANAPDQPSGSFEIRGIIEKPGPEQAPSQWVVAGRWVLGPEAIALLRQQPPGRGGEVGVTEAIAHLLGHGGRVVAVPLTRWERRCDVGNWQSLLMAQALAAVWDEEFGAEIAAAILSACGTDGADVVHKSNRPGEWKAWH